MRFFQVFVLGDAERAFRVVLPFQLQAERRCPWNYNVAEPRRSVLRGIRAGTDGGCGGPHYADAEASCPIPSRPAVPNLWYERFLIAGFLWALTAVGLVSVDADSCGKFH